MSSIHRLVLMCCILVTAACSNAPPRPDTLHRGDYSYAKTYLSWFIDKQRSKHSIPGVSIALVDGDTVVWNQGFGHTDRDTKRAVDGNTRYRVGGLSQVVTAATVLRLQQKGKLDLDQPLSRTLVDLPAPLNDPRITLRRLLSHHGGLPLTILAGRHEPHAPHFHSITAALAGQPLAAAPGSVLAYSELGYDLAGMAAEQAGHGEFAALAQREVLAPLGMNHSAFSAAQPHGPDVAQGYTGRGAASPFAVRDVPALGLTSSSHDLANVLAMLLGGNGLLAAPQKQAMLHAQNKDVPLDLDSRVTLGLFESGEQAPDGNHCLMINGALDGNTAFMALLPGHHLGVVVLANTANAPTSSIGRQALALMYQATTGQHWSLDDAGDNATQPGATPDNGLEGNFDTVAGFAHSRRDGTKLAVRLNGKALELRPLGGQRYALEHRVLGLFPVQVEQLQLSVQTVQGRSLLVYYKHGRAYPVGERLGTQSITSAWQARLGRYELQSPRGELAQWADHGSIELIAQYGLLLAVLRQDDKVQEVKVLRPVDDQHAVIAGLGTNRGQWVTTSRDDRGEVVHYSGLSLRRIGPSHSPSL